MQLFWPHQTFQDILLTFVIFQDFSRTGKLCQIFPGCAELLWVSNIHSCRSLLLFLSVPNSVNSQSLSSSASLPLCSAALQFLRCSWSFLRCFSFCFSSLSRAFLSFSAALWISLMRRFRMLRSDELSTPRPCKNTKKNEMWRRRDKTPQFAFHSSAATTALLLCCLSGRVGGVMHVENTRVSADVMFECC